MAVKTTHTTKLDDLLKPHRDEVDVLKEALKEVTEEQADERKNKAKELIVKCLDLQRQMNTAESQFNSAKKKCDKELGKTLRRLQNMANGRPLDEGNNSNDNSNDSNDSDESDGDDSES